MAFENDITSLFDPADFGEDFDPDFFSILEWKSAPEIYPNGFDVFPPDGLPISYDHIK